MPRSPDVTGLVLQLKEGRAGALDELVPAVYAELQALAHHHMRGERTGHTLDTTALVHEAWVRLVDLRRVEWRDRAHFMAMASRAMRRVLVDHARARLREKRGGGEIPLPLEAANGLASAHTLELTVLDDLLTRLSAFGARLPDVVDCRVFGGLTLAETAEALGVSVATVKRDWAFSRAWLNQVLGAEGGPDKAPDP
jgi:RNA polymerase sigma factor (TIGR02999 family)